MRRTAALVCLLLAAPAAAQPAPRLDAYGDPLPDGALFRIGTTRLRVPNGVESLRFSGDAKKLVSVDSRGNLQIWEVATGKQLQLVPAMGQRVKAVAPVSGQSRSAESPKNNAIRPIPRNPSSAPTCSQKV